MEVPSLRRVLAVVLGALALLPAAAFAGTASVPSATWTTDGQVYSVLRGGSRLYLGGSFGHAGGNSGRAAFATPAGAPVTVARTFTLKR